MTYDTNNVFAKIIRGEIPGRKVLEDDQVLAIHDIAAAAPVHVLVMPKGEYVSFDDFARNAPPEIQAHFFKAITEVARKTGVEKTGYRLITNHGADASQSVPHFHMHLIGGRALGGLLPGDPLAR
jgi:diadenosine tetraphosphate (Ap4A) HIT family hydrolase